ncbi:MAG: NAD(P)H-hydrate epimerase, partial [Pseudomonadota bacterium]
MQSVFVLTAEEMRAAEERGAALPPDQGGLPTLAMMEAAGAALAAAVLEKGPKGKVAVFLGPGANGGDGWVAARALHHVKRDVVVFHMAPKDDLKGDAAKMAALYEGQATTGLDEALNGASVIIDCLFGTGLSRPLEGAALEIVHAINAHRSPTGQPAFKLSADIPSGV